MTNKDWRLFCSHGTVVFYIAQHPHCTVHEIADALALTHRTVWGLVGDLKRARLVQSHRHGRHHTYIINRAGRFPDPLIAHLTVNEALKAIAGKSYRREPAPPRLTSPVQKAGTERPADSLEGSHFAAGELA